MKLLTVQETKDSRAAEMAQNIIRTQEVRKVLAETQKQLRETEATFDMTLSNQRLQFIAMQKEEMERIDILKKESAFLEAQKAALMVPLTEMEDDTKRKHVEVQEILNNLYKAKDEADELQEILEGKLDDATEKEQKAQDLLAEAEKKMQGALAQAETTSVSSQKLSGEMQNLIAEKARLTEDFESGKAFLEVLIEAQKKAKEYLEKKEAELEERELILKDGRIALEKAWGHIKTQQQLPNGSASSQ